MKITQRKVLVTLGILAFTFNMTGCGPKKLLMDTYSPPKKEKEVKNMLETSDSKSGFLEL